MRKERRKRGNKGKIKELGRKVSVGETEKRNRERQTEKGKYEAGEIENREKREREREK